jgi:hypothetical protein
MIRYVAVAAAARTAAPESIPKCEASEDEESKPPIPENNPPTLDFLVQIFATIVSAFSAPESD